MSEHRDEELMAMFQRSDAAAFQELFARYRTPVFRFIHHRVGNPDVAADLTQDVFMKVIHRAQSYAHQAKFSTWVYAIARNATIDHGRRAKHRSHKSLDEHTDDTTPLVDRTAGDLPAPDRAAGAGDLKAHLAAAIESLPADQKEVFVLREYDGLPFDEIAHIVDAPVGTVKSRMRYALEHLRSRLRQHEAEAREET